MMSDEPSIEVVVHAPGAVPVRLRTSGPATWWQRNTVQHRIDLGVAETSVTALLGVVGLATFWLVVSVVLGVSVGAPAFASLVFWAFLHRFALLPLTRRSLPMIEIDDQTGRAMALVQAGERGTFTQSQVARVLVASAQAGARGEQILTAALLGGRAVEAAEGSPLHRQVRRAVDETLDRYLSDPVTLQTVATDAFTHLIEGADQWRAAQRELDRAVGSSTGAGGGPYPIEDTTRALVEQFGHETEVLRSTADDLRT